MCGYDILVNMVSGYHVPLATSDGKCKFYLGSTRCVMCPVRYC